MISQLKRAGIVATVMSLPFVANAATINGQVDIAGVVSLPTSDFSATGNADLSDFGSVILATGDFAGFLNPLDVVTLSDIDFSSLTPASVWEVGGFSFVASTFDSFQDGAVKAFNALGVISHASFDDTVGTLSFTAQENGGALNVSFSTTTTTIDGAPSPVPVPAAGPLLLIGLGGLALARRKKRKA